MLTFSQQKHDSPGYPGLQSPGTTTISRLFEIYRLDRVLLLRSIHIQLLAQSANWLIRTEGATSSLDVDMLVSLASNAHRHSCYIGTGRRCLQREQKMWQFQLIQ
jgi:hypothetical protein